MRPLPLFVLLLLLLLPQAQAESLTLQEMQSAVAAEALTGETQSAEAATSPAREAFIDAILATAKARFDEADGRRMRAHKSGDIYVCKNFTVHLFRENRDGYRMAAYPDVPLVIPNNLPKAKSAPYAYGVRWEDIPAEQGNPFEIAAAFRYDSAMSKAENRASARAFLQQVLRGDYFQMSADYYYGVGAHSLVFIADYDPQSDSVHWTDSNMKGETREGIRYGYVQYDAVQKIDWFVDAICHPKRGATLYRLRSDIVYAP